MVVTGRASYSRTLQSARPLQRHAETGVLFVDGWDEPPPVPASARRLPSSAASPRRRHVLVRPPRLGALAQGCTQARLAAGDRADAGSGSREQRVRGGQGPATAQAQRLRCSGEFMGSGDAVRREIEELLRSLHRDSRPQPEHAAVPRLQTAPDLHYRGRERAEPEQAPARAQTGDAHASGTPLSAASSPVSPTHRSPASIQMGVRRDPGTGGMRISLRAAPPWRPQTVSPSTEHSPRQDPHREQTPRTRAVFRQQMVHIAPPPDSAGQRPRRERQQTPLGKSPGVLSRKRRMTLALWKGECGCYHVSLIIPSWRPHCLWFCPETSRLTSDASVQGSSTSCWRFADQRRRRRWSVDSWQTWRRQTTLCARCFSEKWRPWAFRRTRFGQCDFTKR